MTYVVDFRGRPACPCLAAWLPVFERELIDRGVIRESIDIAQLIGGAAASGGTHAEGGAFDIWQHDDVTVWVARQMGADATWARGAPFDPHAHGVLRGCPHNGPARYQIDAVDSGFNGLGAGGRGAPDDGPRPLSGRTWHQGIEWATQLQEDRDMAEYGKRILAAIGRLEDREKTRDKTERERAKAQHEAVLALLDKLADDVKDDATKAQVRHLRKAVEVLAAPDPEPSE